MPLIREKIIPPSGEFSPEAHALAQSINVPAVIGQVLIDRGVDSFEKARSFFRPSLADLHNPFLFSDMEKAVERIFSSIAGKKIIGLYGDYDVDGITSCALMHRAIQHLGGECRTYLPNRLEEGYGVSVEGVKVLRDAGAELMLTLDCGITACDEIRMAGEMGLDVIVVDHHEPPPILPAAYALLDPKVPGCPYPEKELAGVGVAFKLVTALFERAGLPPEEAYGFLDLVALGSAADIVPLLGENRLLVKFGLERMAATSCLGLRELLHVAGCDRLNIKTSHVVFSVAPSINAVGRLGNPSRAFHLLVTEDPSQASNIVSLLRADNERRKAVDKQVTDEAMAMAEATFDWENDTAIVLASESWHVGVVGISASRLVERFHRPTILIALEKDGTGRGSARSIPGFHLHEALGECAQHLLQFGGHRQAAGLRIRKDQVEAFREKFNAVAKSRLSPESLVPQIHPSGFLRLGDVNERLMRLLALLEPYGPGNRRPVFYADPLRLTGSPSIVGKKHLKFTAVQDGVSLGAIAFGMGERAEELSSRFNGFSAAFGLEENEWNGQTRIQLKIKGIGL